MASTLPPELLAHILKLSQAGRSLREQVQVGLQFESVCRAWYECDNKWRVVAVSGSAGINHLLDVITELSQPRPGRRTTRTSQRAGGGLPGPEHVAQRIKMLQLELADIDDPSKAASAAELLAVTKNVETFEIVVDADGLGDECDCLDGQASAVLGQLRELKHFTVISVCEEEVWDGLVPVSGRMLEQLIASWPKLESITIENCDIPNDHSLEHSLKILSSLGALNLRNSRESGMNGYSMLFSLPPSVRELNLDRNIDFSAPPRKQFDALIADAGFIGVARQLETVCLTDGPFSARDYGGLKGQRGVLDKLVASLDNVISLAIHPCAVESLTSLAELKKLTSLRLPAEEVAPIPPVEPSELLSLLRDSRSLEALAISVNLTEDWSDDERSQLEHAAEPNVKLAWIDDELEEAYGEADRLGSSLLYCEG